MRIALLVIGILIVAAVYFWGIGPQRRRNARLLRRAPERGRMLPETPEAGAEHEYDTMPLLEQPPDEEIRTRAEEDLRDLPAVRHEVEPPHNAPRAARRAAEAPAQLQMELPLDPSALSAPPAEFAAAAQARELIILYLRARAGEPFSREQLRAAFREVGLKFGERRIFHHFGIGAMQGERPLFSVANMFEPGHLDLNDSADMVTSGLAMFLQLPAAVEGAIVFELYMNTADRLARLLHARLLNEGHRELSAADIERMRARVSLSSAA